MSTTTPMRATATPAPSLSTAPTAENQAFAVHNFSACRQRDTDFVLIGLTGRAGVGKDTVGNILRTLCAVRTLALADPIRNMLSVGLDIPTDCFERAQKEAPITRFGKSPRQLMQTLGTEWGRQHVAPDLWTRIAEKRISGWRTQMIFSHIDGVAVTDIRFADEAAWIHAQGGRVWHIDSNRDGIAPVSPHSSETGIDSNLIDACIINDGSIEDLQEVVVRLFAHERGEA